MIWRSRSVRGVAASALCALSACSGLGDEGAPGTGGSTLVEGTVSCAGDPRLDTYTDNMEKPGELGALSFQFSDLEPAPPAKGSNTFHVRVSDASGAPAQGGLGVALRMPDHGHGTSVKPVVSDTAIGAYMVTPLYLFMAGVWRIEFDAYSAAGPDQPLDRVALHFCVEG